MMRAFLRGLERLSLVTGMDLKKKRKKKDRERKSEVGKSVPPPPPPGPLGCGSVTLFKFLPSGCFRRRKVGLDFGPRSCGRSTLRPSSLRLSPLAAFWLPVLAADQRTEPLLLNGVAVRMRPLLRPPISKEIRHLHLHLPPPPDCRSSSGFVALPLH